MKKFAAIILVTLACVMALTSCALTTPDPLTLADKYDTAKCNVTLKFEDAFLAAYGADILKVETIAPKIDASKIKQMIVVQLEESEVAPVSYFYYFASNGDAKNAADALYTFKADLAASTKIEVNPYQNYIIVRQGNMVFFGTQECWDVAF